MGESTMNRQVPTAEKRIQAALDRIHALIQLIRTLRGENGCPWDRKQTPKTMAIYLIEETHELVEAIQTDSIQGVREELGDVLFHILFLAQLFDELGHFDLAAVADDITQKMIRRHPHVFERREEKEIDDIKSQWREIKRQEKKQPAPSILDGIPAGLPALLRAYRVSERAGGAGFDWDDVQEVMRKTEEEWAEFKQAMLRKDKKEITLEFGDILFTLVNVARLSRIHPETALAESTQKFCKRFQFMEKQLALKGGRIESVTRAELERQWEKAKAETE